MNDHLSAIFEALERADPVSGGAAPWVAIALLLATMVFVSADERPRAKLSFLLLLGHFAFVVVLALTPRESPVEAALRLLATALLMASVARSSFLLFVHSFWMRKFAQPLPKILRDLIQAGIFALALLVVLRSAGVEPASLLTTSALLTAVVGLSLQDTLGNLFAGLAIQAQRPFAVGDWIQLDSKSELIGRVIEINWRATRVLTLERSEVTFPNGFVAKSSLINFSRPTPLVRREVMVQAPYDAAPEYVKQLLLSAMDHVPEVLSEPSPRVHTKDFSERGVCYVIRYFIEHFQDRELIDSTVRERTWYALHRANVAIPVPRRLVHFTEVPFAAEAGPSSLDSMFALLRQVPLFEALPVESLRNLASQCRRKQYASEEVIVHRGESSTEMYVLEGGRVRVERRDGGDQVQVVGSLGKGNFFGEMSLMTGEARTADVVADDETTVLVLDRNAVQPMLEKHPELAEHMSRVLAERRVRLDALRAADMVIGDEAKVQEMEILSRIRRFFSS